MRRIGLGVVLALGLTLAELAAEAPPAAPSNRRSLRRSSTPSPPKPSSRSRRRCCCGRTKWLSDAEWVPS